MRHVAGAVPLFITVTEWHAPMAHVESTWSETVTSLGGGGAPASGLFVVVGGGVAPASPTGAVDRGSASCSTNRDVTCGSLVSATTRSSIFCWLESNRDKRSSTV